MNADSAKLGVQMSKPDIGGFKMPSPARNKPSHVPLAKGALKTPTKDNDLLMSMTKRLTQLEKLNTSLRLEVKEKGLQINTLQSENEMLRLAKGGDANSIGDVAKLIAERDKYKQQC